MCPCSQVRRLLFGFSSVLQSMSLPAPRFFLCCSSLRRVGNCQSWDLGALLAAPCRRLPRRSRSQCRRRVPSRTWTSTTTFFRFLPPSSGGEPLGRPLRLRALVVLRLEFGLMNHNPRVGCASRSATGSSSSRPWSLALAGDGRQAPTGLWLPSRCGTSTTT